MLAKAGVKLDGADSEGDDDDGDFDDFAVPAPVDGEAKVADAEKGAGTEPAQPESTNDASRPTSKEVGSKRWRNGLGGRKPVDRGAL
eukprot:scaffold12636_cov176-Amphora_coffeaeformis.AAC.5